jgi:predicted CoA-binding protein
MSDTEKMVRSTAHNVLRMEQNPLEVMFKPKSVAVVGATERPGSVARTILWNLISTSFGGTIFPVNPKYNSILGIKSYPSLAAIPDEVDLAVIVTPAKTVPGIIEECVAVGVHAAIIISAGFQGDRAGGRGAGAADPEDRPQGQHAHHRPQLPGRHEPHHRPERDVRQHHGPARQRSASSASRARC